MKLGVKGTFTLTVRDEDGNVTKEIKFDNLITNNGMDRIAGPGTSGSAFTGNVLYNTVVLSSNNVTPTVTDTTMGTGTSISSTTSSVVFPNTTVSSGSPNYIFTWRQGWRFDTGVAAGTWASIGMFFSTGNILFCKTLIKSGGAPTTLTILATESLDIRYDLTITPVLTDSSGTVTINGTSYSWVGRVWAISDAFAATNQANSLGSAVYGNKGGLVGGGTTVLGAVTAGNLSSSNNPPFTGHTAIFQNAGNSDPSGATWGNYVSGSYTRSFTFVWSPSFTATGGVVSVGGVYIRPGGPCPPYQFTFTPNIPKGITEELSLTFTVTWVRL